MPSLSVASDTGASIAGRKLVCGADCVLVEEPGPASDNCFSRGVACIRRFVQWRSIVETWNQAVRWQWGGIGACCYCAKQELAICYVGRLTLVLLRVCVRACRRGLRAYEKLRLLQRRAIFSTDLRAL